MPENDDTTGSNEPEATAPGEEPTAAVEPETVDLSTLDEAALRERYQALTVEIDEIASGPTTLESAQRRNELRAQRNEVAQAATALRAATAPTDDDVTFPEEAPEPVAAEEPATPATETTSTTEGTAEAATEGTTINEETTVPTSETPASDPGNDPAAAAALEAAETVVNEAASAEMAVTASAERPTEPAVPVRERAQVAYVAGAGQQDFVQGKALDWDDMATAWNGARGLEPGVGETPVQAIVANLPAFDKTPNLGVELLSRGNTAEQNDALIQASVDAWKVKREGGTMDPITAAICEPLDIIREIPVCGETDTPFTDLFPQRPIGRGGFQFTLGSTAVATNGAITHIDDVEAWEEQFDEADVETWKPCIPIQCASPTSVIAEELVTCVTVHSSVEMSSPERVQEFMAKLKVQRARRREQIQLVKFDETASGYTYEAHDGYGLVPSLVEAVSHVLPQLAYPERLAETDWEVVLEPGFINKVTIDLFNTCHPHERQEQIDAALAYIRQLLGLRITVLRDFKAGSPFQAIPAPGEASVEIQPLPFTSRIRLVPASAYIYGSTGEEQTGWQTDPQLVRQNRRQAFSKEWLLLAKHGCHPAAFIDLSSDPNGGRGGCVEPYASQES